MDKTKEKIQRINNFIRSYKMLKFLKMLAVRGAERPVNKVMVNPFPSEGTSFTDGDNITITLWQDFLNVNVNVIKSALEAFIGHEAEHMRSSSISSMKNLAEKIGKYYFSKYQIDERIGFKLGASLYNICEDGRIERIYTFRFPGSIDSFRLINGFIWRKNALEEGENRNVYSDFMAAILCIAKTGVKPKNWDNIYLGTEVDKVLGSISSLIFEIVNSNLTCEVVEKIYELNEKIAPFIKDALENDSEFLKKLDEMQDAGYTADNDTATQQGQASANGSPGGSGSSSAHISGGNSSGAGNSVSDAMNKAEQTDKTPEEIEEQIKNNQDKIAKSGEGEQMEKEAEAEAQKEKEQNSDDALTDKDIDKIKKDYGLNLDKPNITSYSNGINDSNAIEVTEEIAEKGNYIYNSLKKLFLRRDNKDIKNLRKGRLDTKKLCRYQMLSKTSAPEDRIFKKDSKNVLPDVACLGLADISGSTGGILFNKILSTLAILEKGFGPLIPLKLMTYEGCESTPNINILKDFNNKIKRINYSYTFSKIESAGGGTPTAEAMAIAGYELLKRKEKKKLMFILTDGEPNNDDAVEKVTKELRKKGIKVVAILVAENPNKRILENFERMYSNKDFISVNKDGFEPLLIKLLSNWISD